mgnify:CR=1 FL=1
MDYECHITIGDAQQFVIIQSIVQANGWKFSRITNDPDLGDTTFCYATRWFDNLDVAIQNVKDTADIFEDAKLIVIRRKIEQVVSDVRKVNGQWKRVGGTHG